MYTYIRVYFTLFIVTRDLSVSAFSLTPLGIISCSSQIQTVNLQGQGPCCVSEVNTCGITSSFDVQSNRHRVRLKWEVRNTAQPFQGFRLEVWRNAMDECAMTCLTITKTEDSQNLTLNGHLDCTIYGTESEFGLDVLPVLLDGLVISIQECKNFQVFINYLDVINETAFNSSTTTQQSIGFLPSLHQSGGSGGVSLVTVAIVTIAVLFSVALTTVFVYGIRRHARADVRRSPLQSNNENIKSDGRSIELIEEHQPELIERYQLQHKDKHDPKLTENQEPPDSASITSLPESFKAFLKEVNTDT